MSNIALLFPDQEECTMSTVAKVPKHINNIKSEVRTKCRHLNRQQVDTCQLPLLSKETISATKVRQTSTRMVLLKAIRTWDKTLHMGMEDLLVQPSSRTGRICSRVRVKRKGRVRRRGELQIINELPIEKNTDRQMVA